MDNVGQDREDSREVELGSFRSDEETNRAIRDILNRRGISRASDLEKRSKDSRPEKPLGDVERAQKFLDTIHSYAKDPNEPLEGESKHLAMAEILYACRDFSGVRDDYLSVYEMGRLINPRDPTSFEIKDRDIELLYIECLARANGLVKPQ